MVYLRSLLVSGWWLLTQSLWRNPCWVLLDRCNVLRTDGERLETVKGADDCKPAIVW